MTQPPVFLLRNADRSQFYITDQFQQAENAFRASKISLAEYEERVKVLQSLRDKGCYPSEWLADKTMQIGRAFDAGLLTRWQHQNAEQGLRDVMDEAQAQEVSAIIAARTKAEASSAAAEAPAVNGSAEKPKKAAKPTLVMPTPPTTA